MRFCIITSPDGRAEARYFRAPNDAEGVLIRLTARDVAEFRDLYRRHTGVDLTDDGQAREYAERLVALVAFAAGAESPPVPPA